MSIKTISCKIKGLSPLLMHRYPLVQVDGIDKQPVEVQAEHCTYRTPDGKLYIPGTNIQRAIVAGATFSKGKGRASLQKPVAACVFVSPEYCLLNQDKYEIDARSVVIPATKGRIVRARPRFDNWEVSFELSYDDTLLKESELRRIVDDTGNRVGLLDFRPAKNGSFGRFMVIEWIA